MTCFSSRGLRAALSPLPLLVAGLSAGGALTGCAHRPASSGPSASLHSQPGIPAEEYLRGAAQDSAPVPSRADALLLVHPFATNQPAGEARTLAQVFFRVRSAGPDLLSDLAAQPEGTPYLGAQLTVKIAPGFRLVRMHGAPSMDSADGTYRLRWDSLALGDWRVVVAELEGSLPPSTGKERLIGATLRTNRLADGALFETIESTGMEWQRSGSPAKLNSWTARNSLYFADREALHAAERLADQGDPAGALSLLDLQLSSLQALKDLDPQGFAGEEKKLSEARTALAGKVKEAGPAPEALPADTSKEALRTRADAAVAKAAQAPKGMWSTLAGLLAVRVQ